MEFKSLKDLVRIVENSLAVQFYGLPEGQTTVLRKTVLKVLAAVLGGALYMLSLVEKKIWKNRFCSTCDASALDGFGVEYGMPHKAPMSACGYVSVILEDGASAVVVPKGTVLTDSSSSLEYEVAENTTIAAVSGNVFVKALENGASTNLEEGVELEFMDDPIEGVESIFAIDVSGGVAEGVEIDGDVKVWGETAEEYRARLLNRIQNPVNGGSRDDYWRWATRFQFVTDAFVLPNQPNVNSVSVAIANYNSEFIYCSADQVTEVKNYMTDDVRRPITADVRVFSVTPVDVDILAININEYEVNQDDPEIKRAREAGAVIANKIVTINSTHQNLDGKNEVFDFMNQESDGTIRLATMIGRCLLALKTNGVLCVDELERSLHPILVRELLKLFQMRYYTEGTAQLLFTTHLVQLLDDSILRLSEVIIVDKNRQRGTKVKRLIEMKNAGEQIRNVTNFRKRYLKGYYSGVPKAAL